MYCIIGRYFHLFPIVFWSESSKCNPTFVRVGLVSGRLVGKPAPIRVRKTPLRLLGRIMSGGLNQDDFRRILATPRAPAPSDDGFKAPAPRLQKAVATPREGDAKKPFKPRKFSKPKPKKDDEDEDKPAYRDRARERRDGIAGEFEESEQILSMLANK